MRVVIGYCSKEEGMVTALASWMKEIGPYHDHSLLVCRDRTTKITPFKDIGFGRYDEIEILDDAWRSWPQSCNNVFGHAARYIAYTNDEPFLWLEPDVVPFHMKDINFVSAIAREYDSCNRPFLGDYVSVHTKELDVPNHMSGVAVYPKDLINHAGPVFNAHTHAWDIAACKQIVPHMAVSKLIRHVWKHEPFHSLEDVQNNVFFHKPGCVLFHADKSGSLINLLRQQKAGVVPTTISSPAVSSLPAGVPRAAPATATPICDIFIKSYPPDYARLGYCLESIQRRCSGFRRIVLVTPQDQPYNVIGDPSINVVQIPVVEHGEGYLFQQAVKANAHEFTDAEYILHIDSDTMFTQPVTPQTFFRNGKLLWLYTPYSEIETPWQKPTEAFMDDKVKFEFMRRLPLMMPRWLHEDLAHFCLARKKVRLWDYIITQPSRAFSEFNALGALAWSSWSKKFTWLDTTKEPIPPPVALQRWSGEEWNDTVIAECEKILSSSANNGNSEHGTLGVKTLELGDAASAQGNGQISAPAQDLAERRRAQAAHARAAMAAKRATGWKPPPRGPAKKKRRKRRV